MTRIAFLVLFVLGCSSDADDETGPPPACEHEARPERSLRVFAIGHKLEVSEAETYETYAAGFRATVEREVVPHLAPDRPNVLVFPESVAFTAAFLGERGADARMQDTAFSAYIALQAVVQDAFAHYRALAPIAQIGTWILLAASDPIWRAFDQTFSTIAREHGVWVVASIDVGDVEVTTDPALVAALGDPERPEGSPVYEVPDATVYNQAIVYAPSGELVGRLRKIYLTDPEHGELGITGHLPERVTMELPGVAQVAALISRDAWMPDLQERVAAAGTELVLQHEAFSTWTVDAPDAPWPADNLKRSGWAAVQKHPELRMTAAPMLVGNFFDITFDGQSFIAVKGTPSMERRALLAQTPDTGWAAIAPWVTEAPAGTLDEQRAALRAIGESLLPGGTNAGGYVEGTVFADLEIPADDGYPVVDVTGATDAPASTAVAPSGLGRQRQASPVVLPSGALVVAWEDTRFCTGQIVVARSDDDGATFSAPVRVAPWNRPQHTPSLVALDDHTLVVAWQEVMGDGDAEIRVATSRDGGATWRHRVRVDPANTTDAWVPALATDGTTLHLAFVDTRPAADTGERTNRRIYVTRSLDVGATWSAPQRLDPREPDPEQVDPTLTNEWSPRIAVQGDHVVIAYTHRERPLATEQPSWDAHVIESRDGGTTWDAPRRLDEGGSPERIASNTTLAIAPGGDWRAGFSTYRGTEPDAELLVAGGSPTGAQPTSFSELPSEQWWPSLVALPDGDFALAWQDFASGGNDVYLARLTSTGLGEPIRVDDGGSSDAHAWRPRIAAAPDGSLYVFWEDSRTGHAELRVAKVHVP